MESTIDHEEEMAYYDSHASLPHIDKRDKKETKEEIVLCDKSVILFVGDPNEAVREDVTNSLIFAQVAADKFTDKWYKDCKDTPNVIDIVKYWSSKYQETFQAMKWSVTESATDETEVTGKDINVEKILVQVIESIATDQEKEVFKSAIKVLKAVPEEDNRLSLFKSRTVQRDTTQFMVHMIYIDPRGAAKMTSTLFALSTKEKITNVLWFSSNDANTKVYIS